MFQPLVDLNTQKQYAKNLNFHPEGLNIGSQGSAYGEANNNLSTFQQLQMSGNNTTNNNNQLAEALAKATASEDSSSNSNEKSTGSEDTAADSDMRLKRFTELYGDKGKSLVDLMAQLDAYAFTYTPEAQALRGVDDQPRIGVMAQDLEANPAFGPAVVNDTEPKTVDTKELVMNDTAILAEVSKRLLAVESAVAQLMKERK